MNPETLTNPEKSPLVLTQGAFHSTKNFGNSGWESEWKGNFPESHSEFWVYLRAYLTRLFQYSGKLCSIRPFLPGPSFSEAWTDIRSPWLPLRVGSWLSILHRKDKTCCVGGIAARPDPLPSCILPDGMNSQVNSSQVSLVIWKWLMNSFGHCVVFLGKTLNSHCAPLCINGYRRCWG